MRLAKGTTQVGKIPEMIDSGVTVSLGADGASSSGTFDPVRLAFLTAGLFKDARMDPTLVPAETALEMITIEGAKATLADDTIGSIEEGKRADLALYDTSGPEWAPGHDVVRTLIYSADGRSVRTVLVDGQIIYDDYQSTRLNAREVIDSSCEVGARIAKRLGLDTRPRWPLRRDN
jgi:cytosine/adenosine deaminase-related metal-dependent hydrolase